ncbi:uncharacterized protein AMSG_02396 [Thecamonas trahens ATCC 50062]|uniref:Uncharacterized protein n=1 Tax=Thecamonas trahens ATCC 50062 TaxID=461836 RepID=A0A0L0DWG6_THETB|nr:hypothetical protein AMSG_02396 [Thecamonas trahens ATCC 50062]KNC56426.1 hypothetical protein AMSG_02396 [Thecamonas trahens ATCC 50062]|eukprot:XP_013760938.1 hypothetical protein AMSG_02396 [Thecamonas trahens ATCC 50062]
MEYTVDAVVCARWVATTGGVVEDTAVVVSGGQVVDLLPAATARRSYLANEVIELPDSLLTAAFVDAGANAIGPSSGHARLSAALAVMAGTTTLASACPVAMPGAGAPGALAAAAATEGIALGVRVILGHEVTLTATTPVGDALAAATHADLEADAVAGHMFVLAQDALSASPLLLQVGVLAKRMGARVKLVLTRPGVGSSEMHALEAAGLLGPSLLVVNPSLLDDDALTAAVDARVALVYDPAAEAALSSTRFPLAEVLAQSGRVALTAGPGRDMLGAVRLAARLNPGLALGDMLALGCAGGADALGVSSGLGVLARGMQADCVAWRIPAAALVLADDDPLRALVSSPRHLIGVAGVWSSGIARLDLAKEALTSAAATISALDDNSGASEATDAPASNVDYAGILAQYLE